MLDLVKKRIDTSKPATIVDLGCGTGNLLYELAGQPNLQLTGVDASPVMINVARRKLRHLEQRIPLITEGAVEYLRTLPAHSVDYIVMINVLYAVSEREQLWDEILRVLKEDGQAIIANSDRAGSGAIIREHVTHDKWWKLLHPKLVAVGLVDALISELSKTQVFSFLTLRRLKAETRKAGASILAVRRCYGGSVHGVNLLFTLRRSNT